MSGTATDPVLDEATLLGDETNHAVCCDDADTAMCGLDVSTDRIVGDEEATTCTGCIVAEEADVCPLTREPCDYPA